MRPKIRENLRKSVYNSRFSCALRQASRGWQTWRLCGRAGHARGDCAVCGVVYGEIFELYVKTGLTGFQGLTASVEIDDSYMKRVKRFDSTSHRFQPMALQCQLFAFRLNQKRKTQSMSGVFGGFKVSSQYCKVEVPDLREVGKHGLESQRFSAHLPEV